MKDSPIYAPWILKMAEVFHQARASLFLVGGAVRNPLMGLPISDVDVCGPARPEEVMAFCEGTSIHAHLRAAHFGTVELHIVDEGGRRHMAEYTTFREDSYRCGHRPEKVRFTKDISVDALRRDFSVNALYRPITGKGAGEVIDPTGGLSHLRQGLLHTVTEDPGQVLGEDGLRILRAARFQAELGLAPTQSLLDSAAEHVKLLQEIAPERLRDEVEKILMADFRYPMLSRTKPSTLSGLETVCQVGAWPYVFPSLSAQKREMSTLASLEVPEGATLMAGRLALMFWQMKPENLRQDLRRLRFSEKTIGETEALVCAMARLAEGNLSLFEAAGMGLIAVRFACQAFGALAKLGSAQERGAAEARSRNGDELVGKLGSGIPLSLRELGVKGDDLKPLLEARGMPIRQMSSLLRVLWKDAVEGVVANERESLLQAAGEWIAAKQG